MLILMQRDLVVRAIRCVGPNHIVSRRRMYLKAGRVYRVTPDRECFEFSGGWCVELPHGAWLGPTMDQDQTKVFVILWLSSPDIDRVATFLSLPVKVVRWRAAWLRKKGVPLPLIPGSR